MAVNEPDEEPPGAPVPDETWKSFSIADAATGHGHLVLPSVSFNFLTSGVLAPISTGNHLFPASSAFNGIDLGLSSLAADPLVQEAFQEALGGDWTVHLALGSLADAWFHLPPIEGWVDVGSLVGFDFEEIERLYPDNFPKGVSELRLAHVALEGIPVVWVVPEDVLDDICSRMTLGERFSVLTNAADRIAERCYEVLAQTSSEERSGYRALAEHTLRALEGGHFSAAQALAVNVLDSLLRSAGLPLNNAKQAAAKYSFDPAEVRLNELIYRLSVAPLGRFAVQWSEKSPNPRPTTLNRHVSVHWAGPDHYTPTNALLAVMMLVSLLRTLEYADAYSSDERAP